MSYIVMTMNHIRAVKAWTERHGGQANLNLLNFELEVKAQHRYFTLKPQFRADIGGRFGHVSQLSDEVTGFIGWLPYTPLRLTLSADKVFFKEFLNRSRIPTPAMWQRPGDATEDFILKHSVGSFGYDLAGPFHRGQVPAADALETSAHPDRPGTVYAERFIAGQNLKVWCWGSGVFHAHQDSYPTIQGDGTSVAESLASRLFADMGQTFENHAERRFVEQSLRYQGIELGTVLAAGRTAWVDFRYGRLTPQETSEALDNALPRLNTAIREQIDQAAQLIGSELAKEIKVPLLYSLDGMIDASGKVWWLEMNSNPIFPPTGYAHMLATLFGTPAPRTATSLPIDAPQTPSMSASPNTFSAEAL
jgi:hypothetical protein